MEFTKIEWFSDEVTAYKYGLFYKWVLQQQQFIPVVQVGTIENAAVLQVGITA